MATKQAKIKEVKSRAKSVRKKPEVVDSFRRMRRFCNDDGFVSPRDISVSIKDGNGGFVLFPELSKVIEEHIESRWWDGMRAEFILRLAPAMDRASRERSILEYEISSARDYLQEREKSLAEYDKRSK